MCNYSLLNEHIASLSIQQTLFKDNEEFQKILYGIIDRACKKIASSSKKISRMEEINRIYEIINKMSDPEDKKTLKNFIHKTLEDDISIRIVHIISEHENFMATHDQYNNGHVDIVVESKDLQYKWMGEAKLYGGKGYTQQGLEQLVHDYSKGLPNESGGILIYIDSTNIKTDAIITTWKAHLENLSKDPVNKLENLKAIIDPKDSSILYTAHDHHLSNKPYFLKHFCVDLRFN
ncbi:MULTISPECIES: hypothetical protein [Acinetobacter]|uniref:Restriction endonuclease n=1 Tax=Acinetobacter johnsonii TaxID=40214 RepID=A0A3Q8XE42_ACIJO|nr:MULTISPECIES: hypothetical protein [Acinetobacter]AZN62709.1 hypothetical protein CFH90_01050 [Acinetobacter johnsonii]RGD92583.1 hypothetical protein DYI96_04455 [Acinetobacter sp. SWAC57]